ncbi:glycosyltransferase family 2 protein [Cupriavidus basilensis]|uniref:glycosyltransferase family 2 protein n=1 Tax=Cupriavidus basilensis TaxID=68895 RepID=UPI0023E8757E|nr:glycosyltransferase family 2 protein [Cupriavidus basilensis]MDF3886543.1 glycosyltransferase family 2 protein [Cupriavidus basilensis]
MEIVLTENLPGERAALSSEERAEIKVIENASPLGFGANHNQAFLQTTAPYFCVLNPDIEITGNAFDELIRCLLLRPGVAGPRVLSPEGGIEDSARKVPNPLRLLARKLASRTAPDYDPSTPIQQVDWLAGMCLAFDRYSFECVEGFDERFHLYCEDIDICLRMHLTGHSVSWVQSSIVKHDARRSSHQSARYLAWHLASLGRLFSSRTFWRFSRFTPPIVSETGRNPHV